MKLSSTMAKLPKQIIVLKATGPNKVAVLNHQIYASADKPNKKRYFDKFVLIGDTDILGTEVLAMGDIDQPVQITIQSKILNVFSSDEYANWIWEYHLSNIVDLSSKYLVLSDVFTPQDLDKVRYTEQFSFVELLNPSFNAQIQNLSSSKNTNQLDIKP